jgi:hypothetical protein
LERYKKYYDRMIIEEDERRISVGEMVAVISTRMNISEKETWQLIEERAADAMVNKRIGHDQKMLSMLVVVYREILQNKQDNPQNENISVLCKEARDISKLIIANLKEGGEKISDEAMTKILTIFEVFGFNSGDRSAELFRAGMFVHFLRSDFSSESGLFEKFEDQISKRRDVNDTIKGFIIGVISNPEKIGLIYH